MDDILRQIDRLFAEEPVALDHAGYLRHVAEVLAPFDPCVLFLADHQGALMSAYDCDRGESTDVTPALALEIARLLNGQTFHCYRVERGTSSLLAFGQRLAQADSSILGGLLRSPTGSERQLETIRPVLNACGALVWEALAAVQESAYLATRIRHLTAEQDTIKTAHRASAATVIEEREARIQEQRDYVVHLEEEVERRSAALREAMKKAEDASRAKSEFLANVSHEIRTPMTAILGFAEALLEPGLSREEQAAAIEIIRRNGSHLLEIINDILDLSKIEAGRMVVDLVPCRPARVVADVVALLGVRAQEKNLSLSTEYVGPFPETVQTDPTRLRQILINLVGNAIKFTDAGSVRVISRLVTGDQHGPMLQFDIIDTGIGMSRKDTATLFRPFSQADGSAARRFGGTGLGLALSKRLAQRLGGDVTLVQTAPGAGTSVRATIGTGSLDGVRMIEDPSELIAVPVKETAVPSDPGRVLLGRRVLLAEDGPDNQRLICHLLNKAGAETVVVENGRRAVEAALAAAEQGEPFHVIVMDMQMPVMDGYEASQLLRSRGYTGPIVALTAHAMVGDREKCLAVGCDAYAAKPIDRRHLIEIVREHCAACDAARATAL